MARRHHHHHHHASCGATPASQPRSLAIRIMSLVVLILPIILYIISLSFSLKIIYSKDYSTSILYVRRGNRVTDPGLRYWASPFYNCSVEQADQVINKSQFNQKCTRRPFLGSKGYKACLEDYGTGTFPEVQYCQKKVTTASLYVSGAVLVGLGLMVTFAYAVLAFKDSFATTTLPASQAAEPLMDDEPGESEESGSAVTEPVTSASPIVLLITPVLLSFSTLLILLAVICLVAAQAVGISTFVSDRHPTESDTPDLENRWEMGKPALAYSGVAWLSALIGVFVAWDGFGVRGRWRSQ